jgi:hypothetical protein
LQSDFSAIAERLQSNYRAIAERFRTDCRAILEQLQSDCRAIAERLHSKRSKADEQDPRFTARESILHITDFTWWQKRHLNTLATSYLTLFTTTFFAAFLLFNILGMSKVSKELDRDPKKLIGRIQRRTNDIQRYRAGFQRVLA